VEAIGASVHFKFSRRSEGRKFSWRNGERSWETKEEAGGEHSEAGEGGREDA